MALKYLLAFTGVLILLSLGCAGGYSSYQTTPAATPTVVQPSPVPATPSPTAIPTLAPTPTSTPSKATPPPAPSPAATSTSQGTPVPKAAIKVTQNATLGAILTDSSGRSLYMFTKDELKKSNCYGNCAQNWPPLLTGDLPSASDGAVAELVSTFKRTDGATQVTYNGWPLYYWFQDAKPGDTNGQDVGKVWYVLTADGAPVYKSASIKITQNATLGNILTDSSGRSLYVYTKDEPKKSNCAGVCAQRWPPFLSTDAPVAGDGTTTGLLGTIKRADGSTQVTYNSLPLYYWWQDIKPGDVNGQNVSAVWFVLGADGKMITASALPSPTPVTTQTPAPAAAPATIAPSQAVKINIQNFAFSPDSMTVTRGTTVNWVNNDTAPHTVTSTSAPTGQAFDSGNMSRGQTFSRTFTVPGTYKYRCNIHSSMTGTIVVSE